MLRVRETWTTRPGTPDIDALLADPPREPFALLHGRGTGGRWTVFARRPLASFDHAGPFALTIERAGDGPAIAPDLIGHMAYEFGYALEPALPAPLPPTLPVPDARFTLHAVLTVWDASTGLRYDGIRETAGRPAPEGPVREAAGAPFRASKNADTDTADVYARKVDGIREQIRRGNVYQVNLTRQESWSYAGDPVGFARALAAANPAPYSAVLAERDWAIVSSSPECFLSLRDGMLATRPIKGTIRRGATAGEDHLLRAALVGSAKDLAELTMIVDLCRNDLARACDPVSVQPRAFPEVLRVADVWHLFAEIEGRLRAEASFHDVLAALFPAGSITGAPKIAAMTLIRELEPWPRSIYTGAIGWVAADLAQLELSVAIRTAVCAAGDLRFGVGGGVVWDSCPALEYQETLHKSRAIVDVLRSFAP